MKLLELPAELIGRIISFVVGEIGPLWVPEYRLVCKLFAHEIQEEILKRQPLIVYSEDERNLPSPADRHMFTATNNVRFDKLFSQHGGTIISNEILRRQKIPLPIVSYLRNLVDAVLEHEESHPPDNPEPGGIGSSDDKRNKYTLQICTALSSVYYKQHRWRLFLRDDSELREPNIEDDLPAALAAIGQLKKLLDIIPDASYLRRTCSCLSSPLEAAAACNQVDVVKTITTMFPEPECIYHVLNKPGDWAGLIAAMRKGAKETGNILLENCFPQTKESKFNWLVLIQQVARHADRGFMERVMGADLHTDEGRSRLKEEEAVYMLKEGSCSVLRAVIQDGYLDPNEQIQHLTPLTLVIKHHRYDLARILIQNGAHVDGVPNTGNPVTALWHAAKAGYRGYGDRVLPGIRFLLENGADPDFGGGWRSPLQATKGLWPDVHYLLQQAKDHGSDIALHRETWRKYQERTTEEARIVIE